MRAIVIDGKDNVAVCVQPVAKGDAVQVGDEEIIARDDIKTGHKIARAPIQKDEMIIKYGKAIGQASADIQKGDWVHVHNVLDITEQLCDEFARAYRAKGGK